ncbi:MAG: hypothetical protein L0Y72_29575 [Gemmataceae bacterium]|nr:hypothetical protein [Gemmataceae bacterium]MCI0743197.1 hypothetical protein [Gemmataceae bacterium]
MTRTTKLQGLVALGLMLVVVLPLMAAEMRGTIKSLSSAKKELVLTDSTHKDVTLRFDEKTKVFIHGKERKLQDLRKGDEAVFVYEKTNNELLAKEIRCIHIK